MTTQHLKAMLQDIINDRPEQAQAAMHEYFIAKSRELTEGLDSVKNSSKKWVYYKHSTKKGSEKNLDGDEAIDGVAYDEDSGIIQIADMPNFKPSYAELEKRGWRKMDSAQAVKAMKLNSNGQPIRETKESPGEQFSEGETFYCDDDESITKIKGCPDAVKDFIGDRSALASLEGAPSKVSRHFNVNSNNITSLDGLPSFIGGDLDMGGNNLRSLKGIHKLVKHVGGVAYFQGNPIKSHVLGLLVIDGLKRVMLTNDKVSAIINKHLKGDRDVNACQEELIDAGFEDFAQL